MKRFCYIFLSLWVFASCSNDDVESSDVTLEVRDYVEETIYNFKEDQAVYLWATKSWADKGVSKVEYVVDASVLDNYNQEHGTTLKLLPESCYHAEQTVFEVTDEMKYAKFKVMCSPDKIVELGTYGKIEYALPYRIYVNGQAAEDRYGTVIVAFNVLQPLALIEAGIDSVYFHHEDELSLDFSCSLNFDNRLTIPVNFFADATLVSDFNAEYGADYEAVPSEVVTWETSQVTFERKETEKKVLFNVKGDMIPVGVSLLPIRMDVDSQGVSVDPLSDRKYFLFFNDMIAQSNWEASVSKTWKGSGDILIDGSLGDNWMVAGEASEFWVILSLKDENKVANFTGVEMYVQDYDPNKVGQKKAEIYVSMDKEEWELAGTYNFKTEGGKPNLDAQRVYFPKITGKHIKINIAEWENSPYIGFREVAAMGEIKDK